MNPALLRSEDEAVEILELEERSPQGKFGQNITSGRSLGKNIAVTHSVLNISVAISVFKYKIFETLEILLISYNLIVFSVK